MSFVANTSSIGSLHLTPNLSELTQAEFDKLLRDIDTVILDCEGVLWVVDRPTENAPLVLSALKNLGLQVILLTNNSIKPRSELLRKARSMGFMVESDDFITSASVAVSYLKDKQFKQKVYLIGSKGLAKELEAAGFQHLGTGPDVLQHSVPQTVENFNPDPEVGAVIVSYDEHFSYTKLLKAASYLNNPSCYFLATCLDEYSTIPPGIIIPGTGPIVKSVEAVSQREAVIVGKPHPYLFEALKNEKNINPKRTLLIGDTGCTDMWFGNKNGMITVLTMTGANNDYIFERRRSVRRISKDYYPDYYIENLGDILPFLYKNQ